MTKQFSNIELPKVLYKYRSWDNKFHRKLLTKQEIYLANIFSFNDPFDSTIPVRWEKMTEEDCFARNLEMVKPLHQDKPEYIQKEIAKNITESKQLWHPENMKQEGEHTFEKWDSIIGLISLSSKYDDILMWSHYANSHKGIAIGLSTDKLIEDYDFEYIDKVNYSPEYPLLKGADDSTKHFYQRFFTKSIQWQYEQEWRITKNHLSRKERRVKLNKETIVEIVLGCQISDKDENCICSFISKEMPHVKIKKAERDLEKFKINIL